MEEKVPKRIENITKLINKIEGFIFYLSIPFLFLFILPIPWAAFEFGKGLSMYFFGGTLILLEIVKFLLTGRLSIFKSKLDNIVGFILLTALISTIFSQDIMLSLLGYNYNIASGSAFIFITAGYFYAFRSIFREEADLKKLIQTLVFFISITALVSLLSYFQINLGYISSFVLVLFNYGGNVFDLNSSMIIVWIVGVILSTSYILVLSNRTKKTSLFINFISLFFLNLAILLYSFSYLKSYVFLYLFILMIFYGILYSINSLQDRFSKVLILTLILISVLWSIIIYIPFTSKALESFASKTDSNIVLSPDNSWKVAMSSFSENIKIGFFGRGFSTYSVAVNKYLPNYSSQENTSDTFQSTSEFLKIVVESGLIGLLLFLGSIVILGQTLFSDIMRFRGRLTGSQFIQISSAISFVLLIMSGLFFSYTSFIYLILVGLLTIYILAKSISDERNAELFVVEVDFLIESISKKKTQFAPFSIIIVASLILIGLYYFVFANVLASSYVLQAEYKIKENQERFTQGNLTNDQQKTEINKSVDLYVNAINSARWNYVLYRRISILYSENIKLLSGDYKSSPSQIEKDNIIKEISRYSGNAADNAMRSTDISNVVVKNWLNRINIYYDLISLGLTSYLPQAIESTDGAKKLSPYNNVIYYYQAQFQLIEGKPKDALDSLRQSIFLNSDYIPAYIVAGDVEYANKNWSSSKDYYNKSIDLLEKANSSDTDIYKSIKSRVDELNKKITETSK